MLMPFQERGAEQIQRYLLVFLQLHQCCGGAVSAQSRGSLLKHWRVIWPCVSLSFLVRRMGPRAGFSVGSLWAFPERCPQSRWQEAGHT